MKKLLLFTLTILGISQFTFGQTATGLSFEGPTDQTYDYITVADNSDLDFTTSFTFETWVNFDHVTRFNNGWDWACFFAKSRYTESYGLMMLTENSKILRFYHAGLGIGRTDYNWSTVAINTWYHVAVTLSATEAKIYIDGVEVASNTFASGTLTQNNNPLYIGAGQSGGGDPYPFDGKMDEIRLWNTTRTATEIADNMACELNGTEIGLVLNYQLNQGVDEGDNTAITTVTDNSSNGYDGTLNQFALTGSASNFIDTSSNAIMGTCATLSSENLEDNSITLVTRLNENIFQVATNNQASIYDITGKELLNSNNQSLIDISSLTNGTYILKVQLKDQVIVKKFVK